MLPARSQQHQPEPDSKAASVWGEVGDNSGDMCPEKERYMMDLRLQVTVYEAKRVDGMDCPENIFVQQALEQLKERREKVASKKITEPSSEPAAPLDEQAEPITESPEPTLTADVGQPLQDSNFLQSDIVQTLHCETSDYFYFFQATDGHLHSQFHKRVRTVNQAAGSKADSCNWLENVHCAVCGTQIRFDLDCRRRRGADGKCMLPRVPQRSELCH
ncbi:hypothetical protein pipiens_005041 [Culex pipiens pipiens]|uniref:Uncharacterized protein n=1 Tax=Culex pipiens pipiens TaxID=38569 RepID=A0ABD1CCB2_CULPP